MKYLLETLAVLMIIVIIAVMVVLYVDCQNRGGIPVRGVIQPVICTGV